MSYIVLVCGGRDYSGDVASILNDVDSRRPIDLMVTGGAKGADTLAELWAKSNGIHCAVVDALWNYYDRAAGWQRNKAMLHIPIDLCVAFPGGKGTEHMVKSCSERDIPVLRSFL